MDIFSPENVASGILISSLKKEDLWYLGRCSKCVYCEKDLMCTKFSPKEYFIKNMREGNAFMFKFWCNCGEKAKFFEPITVVNRRRTSRVSINIVIMALFFIYTTLPAFSAENKVFVYQDAADGTIIATNGKTSISYREIDCPGLYEAVVHNLADDANAHVFDWELMKGVVYQYKTLHNECIRLRKEMHRLKILNKAYLGISQ